MTSPGLPASLTLFCSCLPFLLFIHLVLASCPFTTPIKMPAVTMDARVILEKMRFIVWEMITYYLPQILFTLNLLNKFFRGYTTMRVFWRDLTLGRQWKGNFCCILYKKNTRVNGLIRLNGLNGDTPTVVRVLP